MSERFLRARHGCPDAMNSCCPCRPPVPTGRRFRNACSVPARCLTAAILLAAGARAFGQSLPAGTQAWECVPGVIRDNGVESFRLEVRPNRAVSRVVLRDLSLRLRSESPLPLQLLDDGAGSDAQAGDGVFTAGPFTYDTSRTMATWFRDDPNSPAGVNIISVGTLDIVETNGTTTQFLVAPSVGLLASNIPPTAVRSPQPDIGISSHLVSVSTSGRHAQSALRSIGGDLASLTRRAYQNLADGVDFFILLSTHRLERMPATATENFRSAGYVHAQVNFTGTGQPLFDNTRTYGSSGVLSGVVILDAGDRGLYSGNLTHELLHHWGPYLDPNLELVETGASGEPHYDPRSNAASLIGGQKWVPGGTLDCKEGRNGATYASPLDLYFMGLIDASQVPPVQVYSSSSPLPLRRCGQVITDVDPKREVPISEIQKYHGVRTPEPGEAQTLFRLVFLAETHDRLLTPTERTFYNILAREYVRDLPDPVPGGPPDPRVAFNWAPITHFFGTNVTWKTDVRNPDLNNDNRLDLADLSVFRSCATRAGVPQGNAWCLNADFDGDEDVDQDDFGLLQRLLTAR